MTSVTIPNSVTSIDNQAFYNCTGLTSIEIPNSVTSIGASAFLGCSGLTSVTIPNSVTSIGGSAFCGCKSLTSVTIPNSVTSIGDHAFQSCTGLTSVTIPNSVTSIGEEAFRECTGLTSIEIPNSVTSIGSHAFYYCSGLTSVTIPNSVTEIGDGAFYHCTGLTSPVYNAHVFAYMPTSYSGAYAIPEGIKNIAGYAFYGCTGLTSVTIPNSVISIGGSVFYECNSLTSIIIPNSVTYIGYRAFAYCSGLTSVTIPDSVTSIGQYAFYRCTSLKSVTIPNSVTIIDYRVFQNCTNLTSVLIPNSVTSIKQEAFAGCTSLSHVTIPNSVTTIGQDAFLNVPVIEYNGYATGYPWGALQVISDLDYEHLVKVTTEVDWSKGGGSGSIKIDAPRPNEWKDEWYKGTMVTLTATPHDGGMFKQWSDGNTDNPRQVKLTQDTTFVAEFEHLYMAHEAIEIANSLSYGKSSEDYYLIRDYLRIDRCGDNCIGGYYFTDRSTKLYFDEDFTNSKLLETAFEGKDAIHVTIYAKLENIRDELWATSCIIRDGIQEYYTIGNFTYTKEEYDTDKYAISYTGRRDVELPKVEIPTSVEYYNSNLPITAIDVRGFLGCKNLKEVVISDSIAYIDYYAFEGCTNLHKVTIGKNVKSISQRADACFSQCSIDTIIWNAVRCSDFSRSPFKDSAKKIKAINLGNDVEQIPAYLFDGAENVQNLELPLTLSKIGKKAFEGCKSLKTLAFGPDLETYSDSAFYNCKNLKSIYNYRERPARLGKETFGEVDYFNCTLYVLEGSVNMYKSSGSDWKDFYFIEPIGAQSVTTETVEITPYSNTADIVWPTVAGAASYELIIRDKNGEEVCSLVFNANGQLTSIVFHAPARNNALQEVAEQTAGFSFTITGLNSASKYAYVINAKDASNKTIETFSGIFYTEGYEASTFTILVDCNDNKMGKVTGSGEYEEGEEVTIKAVPYDGYRFVRWSDGNTQKIRKIIVTGDATYTALFAEETSVTGSPLSPEKILRNGQLLILRDGKTYTVTGARVE